MLPNNLKDNEITFAKCHTTSNIHKNKDITISKNLTNKNNGISINLLSLPLSYGI
jgi:hypothetical protein